MISHFFVYARSRPQRRSFPVLCGKLPRLIRAAGRVDFRAPGTEFPIPDTSLRLLGAKGSTLDFTGSGTETALIMGTT